ncbi:cytochrome ubiquinol oxidase subunit I [Streptomyces radiopugnans]|nr:cytochrome ubiquinol oxidase subunit I [Streptomyces radiopugnans]
MDGTGALDLARWQFALTAAAHFLFVSLTLGLATVVTAVQTWAVLRRGSGGDGGRDAAVRARMVRFWGQLYVVNYAVGIATGIAMEFQFGLAWSGLGHYAGDVLGASLAMETIVAFFVESTFLGLWIFGWNRFGPRLHCALLWVVTGTAYLSAYWILVANGFLNHPVGYARTAHGIELADAPAVLANPSTLLAFGHIAGGALLTAAFFVAGVSAYHLQPARHVPSVRGRHRAVPQVAADRGLPRAARAAVDGGVRRPPTLRDRLPPADEERGVAGGDGRDRTAPGGAGGAFRPGRLRPLPGAGARRRAADARRVRADAVRLG